MADFSKAIDLVNRNILFFKLIKAGFHAKVIDILHGLYCKPYSRWSANVCWVPLFAITIYFDNIWPILEIITQNIMGSASLMIVFGANNCMIINELKTKAMVFGAHSGPSNIHLNGHPIQTVSQYKYLGKILTATLTLKGDIFQNNHSYLCNKARKAAFRLKNKLKPLGSILPRTSFYLFETLIRPILLYGSDVWGISIPNNDAIDKVFYQYVSCIVKVIATTSNVMVIGESGQLPPGVSCISMFYLILGDCKPCQHTQLWNELIPKYSCGSQIWVTKVFELSKRYGIKFDEINSGNFKL